MQPFAEVPSKCPNSLKVIYFVYITLQQGEGSGPRDISLRAGPGRAETPRAGPGRAESKLPRAGPGRAVLSGEIHGPGRAGPRAGWSTNRIKLTTTKQNPVVWAVFGHIRVLGSI